ncbi:PAS domain-containing hybrid sensor histidine kinase/response regulator [Arenibacter certesii]|uniref:Sensory/regulatory protein RpfC n=1 Tax=Arenibacter certesii TaxID=228955 RepID=A0A918ITI5_9FLAO|nr:PAS domain-containing hybrid sensor histidine kinase/response regulator [Arenibacter certesii]GGW30194.1 hypothetical protein GCM10007383_14340 [Arenibacter certesii]
MNNNHISTVQDQSLSRLRALNNLYKDIFDFLIYSVSEMLNIGLCTITIFKESEVYVIATTDDSIRKIWPLDPALNTEEEDKGKLLNLAPHSAEKFNVKFSRSLPIIDYKGTLVGSLNIFDDKEKTLTQSENKFLAKAIYQVNFLVASKFRDQRLEKHDNLFTLSNDLIGIISFNGLLITHNPSFTHTLGWSSEKILHSPFTAIIHEDDLDETAKVIQKLMKGESVVNFTNRGKTKGGDIKWMEWTSTPDMDAEVILTIGRDVTEFVKREQLLEKSEQKFHNLFNNVKGILSIHDLEGNFIEVNPAGLAASEYSEQEMKQSSIYDLVAADRKDKIEEYLSAVRDYGKASGEMTIIKKSGKKEVWYFMSTLDEDETGNKRVLTNVIDISERKILADELLKAKEEAEEALKVKSQFIANMSHEIRTPLNGIIGFTELALATKLEETQKQYLEIINQSGVALYNIINDILDFSKIESNKMKLEIDKVDVEEVVSEAFNIVSFGINKKGLEMLIDIDHNIPPYIWADATRLKQILVHLLGNALKFTEKGEIKLYVTILEDCGNNKMRLRFGISDTGIGIHKDKQKEIFSAFTQEDGSITKRYGGTGLGLTISNKLLALGNSNLQLESEQGKGSDFYFDVEFKVEKEDIVNSLEDIKRVLIVDDNENTRKILRRMLEIKNIEVEEADSGLKALLIMMDQPNFDVIIMDYHMPVMDGIETIGKIKGLAPSQSCEIPFIVLYNSSDDDQLQAACDELEVESRLVKPIRMRQMYQTLSGLKNLAVVQPIIAKNEISEPSCPHLKILIAEDNEINMQLTKLFLQGLVPNAAVVEALNGAEAVEKYTQEKPDIVLMDVQMPITNGLEATRQIRASEDEVEVPIIALTAGSLPGEKERCLDAGMTDFLAKPLLQQSLGNMLTKWLGETIYNQP